MVNTYLIILLIQFIIGFLVIQNTGGLLQNIYFSFCLSLYFLYFFVSSLALWNLKNFEIFGLTIEDIYPEGLIVYNIGIFFFILGYLAKFKNRPKPLLKKELYFEDRLLVRMTILLLLINYFIRFFGSGLVGTLETYLWLTQDFLILLTIALYSRKINPIFFYFTLISAIYLFSLNFFRYRIFLTIIGIGVIYLHRNPKVFKQIGRYILIFFATAYVFLFFTINRGTLTRNSLDKVNFNIFNGSSDIQGILLSEGSDVHADFTIIKYFKVHPTFQHDYGQTIFIFPFIRALPSFLFPGGIKPFPPSLKIIVDSYGGDVVAQTSGRAISNVIEDYVAFGLPGVILFMFLFGYLLKYLQNHWIMDGGFNELLQIAILISFFQYITRGYFPQYITHLAYLVLPILILRTLSKKTSNKISIQSK